MEYLASMAFNLKKMTFSSEVATVKMLTTKWRYCVLAVLGGLYWWPQRHLMEVVDLQRPIL